MTSHQVMVEAAAPPSEPLARLAAAHGISTEFWSFTGEHRQISASTITSALTALGVAAGNASEITQALHEVELSPWRRTLPPSLVLREGRTHVLAVHVPDGASVRVEVELESGELRALEQVDLYVEPMTVDGEVRGRASFEIPADLPLGWHTIRADVAGTPGADAPHDARCVLAITPDRLALPELRAELGHRAWGFMAQVYSVRSRESWGVGDFADLAEIGSFAGGLGADFVLVNPLHAGEPTVPQTPSPYLPVTRRFVSPAYIRPEDVREAAYLPSAQRALVEWAQLEVRQDNTEAALIDRDASWKAKLAALEVIATVPRSTSRERAYAAYRQEQGRALADFALWCALREHFGGDELPPAVSDIASPAVSELAVELADRVEFFTWLQWVADEQLASAQHQAVEAGMRLGVMHDLAVGVHPRGADVWMAKSCFAAGIGVGAPPDMYNQQGQNWSQPPWRPDELERLGYAPWRDMVRAILRHAGALRIDHVIGLFRLWWVPDGAAPGEGAYVRYDHEAMVGVLVLEAQRAGAVIIGEDLGTVEPWVRDYLSERGILGTSVLWFEKGEGGAPLPPEAWRRDVLATVTTHDLPPTAGYLEGEHVALRERLGLLTEAVEEVRMEAERERDAMVAALRDRHLLPGHPSEREAVEALHRFVAQTPSVLVGVSLADAVGERRAQNQPGTDSEYPNWRIPLADSVGHIVGVEDLVTSARLASLATAVNRALAERALDG